MGFLRAPADASAKLMELGEAEALGMLDDHNGGVGDVDADFHHSCGHEDLRFVLAEARYGRGGEDEDVRSVAMRGGFVHQTLALEDAEAMLLVNGDKAEPREFDVVFD